MGPFLTENGFEFDLETFEGWKYTLEVSEAVDAAHWEGVAEMVGTGKTRTLRDRSPVLPHRFYRVQMRP